MKIKAVSAYSAKQPLEPMDITRREPGPNDVKIEIAYCGVCHSDLHQVRSEWAGTVYPCVPGHEIVGRVVAVGDQVEKYAPGDLVGVGCIVDSCKHCEECEDGLENYCDHMTGTYNSPTRTNRAILWAATHNRSSFMSDMFCVFVTRKSSWRRWLLCCVQGSPRIRRYVTGRPGRVKKWAWSASAVWDIWGLSWPTRWGHMWWHLPLLRQNAKRQKPGGR